MLPRCSEDLPERRVSAKRVSALAAASVTQANSGFLLQLSQVSGAPHMSISSSCVASFLHLIHNVDVSWDSAGPSATRLCLDGKIGDSIESPCWLNSTSELEIALMNPCRVDEF